MPAQHATTCIIKQWSHYNVPREALIAFYTTQQLKLHLVSSEVWLCDSITRQHNAIAPPPPLAIKQGTQTASCAAGVANGHARKLLVRCLHNASVGCTYSIKAAEDQFRQRGGETMPQVAGVTRCVLSAPSTCTEWAAVQHSRACVHRSTDCCVSPWFSSGTILNWNDLNERNTCNFLILLINFCIQIHQHIIASTLAVSFMTLCHIKQHLWQWTYMKPDTNC